MADDRARPATLRDVARAVGVSTATVSLALRGHARISAATRKQVEAAAARVGYRRNPAFAILGAMAHRHPDSRSGLPLGYVRQRNEAGNDVRPPPQLLGMHRRCQEMGYPWRNSSWMTFPAPPPLPHGCSNGASPA